MFGGIIRMCLQFRILVLALAAGIIAFGIINVPRMPVDTLPEFAPAQVEIQTEALGLSAVEVEQLITAPMEADLLNGVAWLDEIRSKSVPGLSSIELIFQPGTDLLRARQLVAERMTQSHALPNVSSPPLIMQPISSSSRVLMVRMTSSQLSGIDLSVLARWKIKPRLIGVTGVANVSIWGQREQQLQVEVNPAQLRDKGVTLEQIIKTTGNAVWVSPLSFLEASTPGTGGFVESGNQRLGIQHVLPIRNPKDLSQVTIEDSDPRLVLGDVAQVKEDHQPLIGDAIVGQDAGLLLVVEKFPGTSTLQVTRDIEAALKDMEPGLSGVTIDTSVFRPASALQQTLDELGIAFLLSLIIAVGLIWLVFRSWRAALIAFAALATSVTAAVVVLQLLGATLNITVLAGIFLAVLLIVGDIVEDVQAQRRRTVQRVWTAADGAQTTTEATPPNGFRQRVAQAAATVRTPMFHAGLIMVLSLLPLLFSQGIGVSFFRPLIGAMALALLSALVVGLSVTPVLAHLLLQRRVEQPEVERPAPRFVAKARHYYGEALDRTRGSVVAGIAVLAVLGLAGLAVGSQLIGGRAVLPTLPDRTILVQWDATASASNTEVSRIAAAAAAELRTLPGVAGVGGHVGRAISADQVVGTSSAELWVSVAPGADYRTTENAVSDVVRGYPGIANNVVNYSQQQIGDLRKSIEPGFAVRVFGVEFDLLAQKAEEVRKALMAVEGISNPRINATPRQPIVEIEVNLDAAQKAGIKPGDARRAAAALLQGIIVGNLFEQQKVFEVVVRGQLDIRDDLTSVQELILDTPDGKHVKLGQIASVRIVPNETVILHDDTSRRVDVVADVGNRPLGDIQRDVQAALQKVQFPMEYHAEIPTTYSDHRNADLLVLGLAGAVLVGVLILLQTALRSWKLALAVSLGLPAAMFGALIAAWLGGQSTSLLSLAAFATVLGIAARNAAVLGAVCDQLRRENPAMKRSRIVHQAAGERVAPVLKGALLTALVMVPPAMLGGVVAGALLAPMLLIVIGGLVTTTLFALFVLPLLFLWFGPDTGPEEWEHINDPIVRQEPERVATP